MFLLRLAVWLSWERMSEAHVVYLGPLPVGLPMVCLLPSVLRLAISRLMGKQLLLMSAAQPSLRFWPCVADSFLYPKRLAQCLA